MESEKRIKELETLKKKLKNIKNQYYLDYFNEKREGYAKLEDIPNIAYLKTKEFQKHDAHPLSEYSIFDLRKISKMIESLFLKYEGKEVQSKLFIQEKIHTHDYNDYIIEIPYYIIGTSELNLDNEKNIIIPLTEDEYIYMHKPIDLWPYQTTNYYSKLKENKNLVKCVDQRSYKIRIYEYYSKLINKYRGELSFDYKKHTFIRDLIFNLAYYKKHDNIGDLDDEELTNVFKKIYKINN